MPNRLIFKSDPVPDKVCTGNAHIVYSGGVYFLQGMDITYDSPRAVSGFYGDVVNIGVPHFPQNAILKGYGYLVSGTLQVAMSASAPIQMWDTNSGSAVEFFPGDVTFPTDAAWTLRSGYVRYSPCPYPGTLINGMEVLVDRGVPVCSGSYGKGQPGAGPPYTADDTHTFNYHDETQTGGAYMGQTVEGGQSSIFTWFGARQGQTVALNMWAQFVGSMVPAGSTLPFTAQIINTLSDIRLIIIIEFMEVTAPSWLGPHVIGDTYNNVTGIVWVGAASGGNKPLYVGVNRGIQKSRGSGSGSTAGWEVYHLMDIAAGSDWGMSILPSGRMEVMYDSLGTNGAATAQYRYSDNWQLGAAANWSVAAALTPNRSQAVSIGRAQKQAWRFTVTG